MHEHEKPKEPQVKFYEEGSPNIYHKIGDKFVLVGKVTDEHETKNEEKIFTETPLKIKLGSKFKGLYIYKDFWAANIHNIALILIVAFALYELKTCWAFMGLMALSSWRPDIVKCPKCKHDFMANPKIFET